jgi:hypothetical protein
MMKVSWEHEIVSWGGNSYALFPKYKCFEN